MGAKEEAERQRLAQKIIMQMLNKEKQRRLYISFAQATSNLFASELIQVRVNAIQIFHNIEHEIHEMDKERKLTERKISGPQPNLMMQSQLISSSKTKIHLPDRMSLSIDGPLTAKAGKTF